VISISVTHNIDETIRRLQAQARQVPFAISLAINRTAQLVKEDEIHEMRDVFDRPTPYTLNSLYLKPSTKQTLTAKVWLKEDTSKGTPAAKYLLPQIQGGARRLKRFESALRRVGALPEGMVAVPATGAKFDPFGNMDRGQIVQILSYFRAFPEAGYKANMTDKGRAKLARGSKKRLGVAYFVGAPADGKLPLGVWQRTTFAMGSAIKPVLLFVDAVHYQMLFDFPYVAKRVIDREFDRQFEIALRQAMATAR
jgi:hypothetical protein